MNLFCQSDVDVTITRDIHPIATLVLALSRLSSLTLRFREGWRRELSLFHVYSWQLGCCHVHPLAEWSKHVMARSRLSACKGKAWSFIVSEALFCPNEAHTHQAFTWRLLQTRGGGGASWCPFVLVVSNLGGSWWSDSKKHYHLLIAVSWGASRSRWQPSLI